MRLVRCLVLLCLVSVVARPVAAQTSYEFYVLYYGGGSAVLAPGSDNPVGTNLQPGDDFFWSIAAQDGNAWTVEVGDNFPLLMAFNVGETGIRFGDLTLSLLLNGVAQYSQTETNVENRFVHLGTSLNALPTGLIWDTMILEYALLSSTSAGTTPQGLLPIFGPPEASRIFSGVSYGPGPAGDVVPEPATMTLLATGLAGLAAGRRRRKA